MTTLADLVRARTGDTRVALRAGDRSWTWDEHVRLSQARAAWLERYRDDRPFHVGVLLDNVPELSFVLGAAALGGAAVVCLNPTRSDEGLLRDVVASDCRVVLTARAHRDRLAGLDPTIDLVCVDDEAYRTAVDAADGPPAAAPVPDDVFALVFTSGTGGDPKAVRTTHRLTAERGLRAVSSGAMRADDVVYVPMPLFHSAALRAAWAPGLAAGATLVLRERFSASAFLPDVRRHGVTYLHYVGKALSYILATPERPDDADTTLRIAVGNEGAEHDLHRFATRFGCRVQDNYGSTEGGVAIRRSEDTPPGALGRPEAGIEVVDPGTGAPVATARLDADGNLLNPEEAIGELVNTTGHGSFEGYYGDGEAEAARTRNGWYWSGDLAFRDADGFVYFGGRTGEWLRVDGENMAVAPIERVVARYPGVLHAAVYAVPDPAVGDQVMAAIEVPDPAAFDPGAFAAFLAAQRDLAPKGRPRFVRVGADLPNTITTKIRKRELVAQRWETGDPVWWRPGREDAYRPLTAADVADLGAQVAARHRRRVAS